MPLDLEMHIVAGEFEEIGHCGIVTASLEEDMPRLFRAAMIGVMVALSGCGAEMVQTYGGPSKYGPTNPGPRGGIVRYLNQGSSGVIASRREDALKKMFDQCDGKYKILKEGATTDGSYSIQVDPTMAIQGSNNYWAIQFECEK